MHINFLTPAELTTAYAEAGLKKTRLSIGRIFVLGCLAGAFIAFASACASTASHNLATAGMIRLVNSLIFPFGLCMVILMGTELFTGNCLMVITLLDKQARFAAMLKNWVVVYIGNFVGSIVVAAGCAYSGQFNHSAGGLAVTTIRVAVAKCSLHFGPALILGIFCNFLVCVAVLQALAAKDVSGKILAIFLPVCFFVLAGFEHCVANMYYISAGLFALTNDSYRAAAVEAGINISVLTWGNFIVKNLIPVTLGNIIGGCGVGLMMWGSHMKKAKMKCINSITH